MRARATERHRAHLLERQTAPAAAAARRRFPGRLWQEAISSVFLARQSRRSGRQAQRMARFKLIPPADRRFMITCLRIAWITATLAQFPLSLPRPRARGGGVPHSGPRMRKRLFAARVALGSARPSSFEAALRRLSTRSAGGRRFQANAARSEHARRHTTRLRIARAERGSWRTEPRRAS